MSISWAFVTSWRFSMLQNFLLLMVSLTCCLLATGCGQPTGPSTESNEPVSQSTPASTVEPAPVIDLSVPRLEPKPVVWLDELSEKEPAPKARREAKMLTFFADRSKASEQYEKAEQQYQEAIQADPTWGYPVYQLACNYELWDRHSEAMEQFNKAVELGFDNFPTALADDELGRIREDSGFNAALVKIRERYITSSATRVGQPFAIRPDGDKPAEGWPVMLLLHGYGDSNLSYRDSAEAWAGTGFLSVAVPGSVPAADERYMWSMESIEPTHQDVQAIVSSPLLADELNPEKVFLLGFSQGALHAMLLTAEHPDAYAGVVGLSPGGSLAQQLATPPLNRSGRTAKVVFIHGDQEPHAPYVSIWGRACKAAGWPFRSKTHPGGHHFPDDWERARPVIAEFLLNQQ